METGWLKYVMCFFAVGMGNVERNPSKQWERCFDILSREKTAPCTKYTTKEQCSARKIMRDTDLSCRTDDPCPLGATPHDLQIEFFTEPIFLESQNESFGVNVSWTIKKSEQQTDNGRKTFVARVDLNNGNSFLAEVTFNLEEDDFDENGNARVYYDCFFPLRPSDTQINVTVMTYHYDNGKSGGVLGLTNIITPLSPDYTATTDRFSAVVDAQDARASGDGVITAPYFMLLAVALGVQFALLKP